MACINSIINVLEDSVLYRNQLTGNIQGLVAPPIKSRQLKIDTMISQPEGFKAKNYCVEKMHYPPPKHQLIFV